VLLNWVCKKQKKHKIGEKKIIKTDKLNKEINQNYDYQGFIKKTKIN
jgi:hypothetical protein